MNRESLRVYETWAVDMYLADEDTYRQEALYALRAYPDTEIYVHECLGDPQLADSQRAKLVLLLLQA